MADNDIITARLGEELTNWLKQKVKKEGNTVSEMVKKAVKLLKEMEDIPEDMRFSPMLQVQGAKASILTFRLIEKLAPKLIDDEKDLENLLTKMEKSSRKDIEEYRISTEK
jgi:Arc/MetJ-type ribon-helix-helix transcriptional regulator